ncbi:copper amine oxidase N-terminal domain-containing protein [Lachnospiraceae bacterium 46-61]
MKKTAIVLSIALLTGAMGNTITYARTNYTIDKTTINGLHTANRYAEVKDIIITEPAAGLFEKNKIIYLKADRLDFEEGATVEITKGNIRIKEIEVDEDILKLTIEKASSEASEIKISNIKFYVDGNLADGTYDLDLITEESEKYKNNVFGGFYEQSTEKGNHAISSITLIKDFVTISTTPRDKQQTPIIDRNAVSITVQEQYPQENSGYLQNGIIMVPLRAVVQNSYHTDAVVQWDDETKAVVVRLGQRICSMKIGDNVVNVNGVITPMTAAPEIKNGRIFIPIQDLAYILGISENKIQWDSETMTVTLN